MRKVVFMVLFATVGAIAITSCSESEEEYHEFDNWEARNWAYFTDKYKTAAAADDTTAWRIIRNWSLNEEAANDSDDFIVVEVLENGTGSGCPMYSDSVYVHYYGKLIPSDSYPDGYNFDGSYEGDFSAELCLPTKFAVSALIDGFVTALLNMHIGDYWRVYVPYTLGYGTTDSGSIPAYSTLIFDIYLEAYYRIGTTVPMWKVAPAEEYIY